MYIDISLHITQQKVAATLLNQNMYKTGYLDYGDPFVQKESSFAQLDRAYQFFSTHKIVVNISNINYYSKAYVICIYQSEEHMYITFYVDFFYVKRYSPPYSRIITGTLVAGICIRKLNK